MKKSYLFLAMAAMTFAACSENDVAETQKVESTAVAEIPLSFEAYTQRGLTRSGAVGDLTLATTEAGKKVSLQTVGFGVFGYYTDNNQYDAQALPNFMYNEPVKYESGAWTYAPIKYWPNEYGSNAISDDYDKVSFFAYAPYVEVTPATGKVPDATWGIAGLTRNTAAGDPVVKYIGTFDVDKAVDLCWGVVGKDATAWPTVQPHPGETATDPQIYTQIMDEGMPWIDVERPGLSKVSDPDQKLKFTFLHALAKLNVTIDIAADDIVAKDVIEGAVADDPATTDVDESQPRKTKVYVRSISFSGFAQKGALNLNNDGAFTPKWVDFSGTDDLTADDEIIIYDGRKDGKEGVASAVATNEKVLGLNPAIISNDGNTTDGVTGTTVNLFRKAEGTAYVSPDQTAPIYIIPRDEDIVVNIVYDIETMDENLPTLLSDGKTYGSSVENRIRKTISFGTTNTNKRFEAGKAYTIALHLGMNSVKFDADIKAWEDATSIDVDLPSNLPVYEATAAANTATTQTHTLTLPAGTTKYAFAVKGLNAGEDMAEKHDDAGPANNGYVTVITTDDVKGNGIAQEEATLTANMYTTDRTGKIQVWGKASLKGVNILVTQQAHALGLQFTVAGNAITLSSKTTGVIWANTANIGTAPDVVPAQVDPASTTRFIVKKNGTVLSYISGTGTPAPNQFKYEPAADGKTATITLGEPASVGDVFTITIQAGDAKAETYSYTVE